jgi:hypothetical protein
MIVNITVGEWDSMSNPLQILQTLEGPLSYEVLKDMWDTFEANIEGTIGHPPQQPFHPIKPSRVEQAEFNRIFKLWSDNRKALHKSLKETWGIPPETEGFLNTRYFIEFLIKHHGYRRIESVDLFTENC